MNKYKIHILAIFISLVVHVVLVGSVLYWNMFYMGSEKGVGFVEVDIIGDGNGFGNGGLSEDIIPAKTGTQKLSKILDPRFRGDDEKKALDQPGSGSLSNGIGFGSGSGNGAGGKKGDPRLGLIWKKINAKKYYPVDAKKNNFEGSPKIAFSISLTGKVKDVVLVKSSGSDLLDKAAIDTVKNSSPLPFYPQRITIALKYSLK